MRDGSDARAFLSGGSIRVDPTVIEHELALLWRPAAEDTHHDDEEMPAVTRVSLGTQVLVADAAEAVELEQVFEDVAALFPCRGLLVLVDPNAGPELSATVSAACHLAAPGEPQVCSERITMRTGPAGLERLAGAALPLLEPDVPATLVWSLATPPPAAIARDLVRVMDRCLTDLTRAVDPAAVRNVFVSHPCRSLSDLAWSRARAWREAVAQLFDAMPLRSTAGQIDGVEILARMDEPGALYPAAVLAGWIAGQLGWSPLGREGRESAWRRPGGGMATVRLQALGDERPTRLQSLLLRASVDDAEWRVERLADHPRELHVAARHRRWCQIPWCIPSPRPEPAQVLLAALTAPPENPVRDRALANAAWLLGWEPR